MAKKIGGLGKGLEALFADNSSDETHSGALSIKISQIEPNKDQPRKVFADEALIELSESIKEHGLIQPILVKPMPSGQYKIVAGERRWRASRLAGLTEIPVLIKELTNQQVMEIALIENLQREDLNPIEEAMGYKSLIDEFKMTQEQVAQRVGKSRPVVANALRILSLPESVIKQIESGIISTGHGKVLLSLEDKDEIIAKADIIAERGLSVRESEQLIKVVNKPNGKTKEENLSSKAFFADPYYKEVQIALENELGRAVKVNVNDKNVGKLEIEFYNKDDLAEMIKKFTI